MLRLEIPQNACKMWKKILVSIALTLQATTALSKVAQPPVSKSIGAKECSRKPIPKSTWQKNVADCTKEIAKHPYYASLYSNRAYCYSQLGEFQKAYDDYSTEIKLNPKSSASYVFRGGVLENLGKPEQAMDDYNEAVKLSRKHFFAFQSRGDAFFRRHRLEDALADYKQARQFIPERIRSAVEPRLKRKIDLIELYLRLHPNRKIA